MKIDLAKVKELATKAVEFGFERVASSDVSSIKLFATGYLLGLLETYDNFIPVIGMFADLPAVDDAQEKLVGFIIDRAYTAFMIEMGAE